ncbi:MAG: TrpR-related protein YerC/YecD [Clostridiales bacterium]|jgi:TrpR-related protein YerC/YecD|nr:TrpR-related protein YerC/YecD [Clostridiales bacterium]
MKKPLDDHSHRRLYEVLAKINKPEDIQIFLEDLCTINEVNQMSQRLQCAELMLKGYTYSQITELSSISSATLSRVSRCLQYGSGGYSKLLASFVNNREEKNDT